MNPSIVKAMFAPRRNGNTIFHELAYTGSETLLYRIKDIIYEPYASMLQQVNDDGDLSIHVAASRHRGTHAIKIIKALVEMGVDLNATNDVYNFTVLHIAVENDDHILVKWLLEQPQIDLNVNGWDGLTACEMAWIVGDQLTRDTFKKCGVTGAQPGQPAQPQASGSKSSDK